VAPDLLDLFAPARQANGSVSEPAPECVDGDGRAVGGEQDQAAGSGAGPVAGFEHAELEARLAADGRELARQVL
jgi:hypothetical protein